MEKYDLVIIGGGPAGYTAAERAASGGFKTILFEESKLGGVCLNEGCVPTKVMLNTSKLLYCAKTGDTYGVIAEHAKANDAQLPKNSVAQLPKNSGTQHPNYSRPIYSIAHDTVLARKEKVVRTLAAGVRSKLRTAGAIVRIGRAEIVAKGENGYIIKQATGDESGSQIEAERMLIATGSIPIIPSIAGKKQCLQSDFAITSSGALSLAEIPKNLVIVGGGIIGLELADYFNAAGSNVTVIEALDRIAYQMEADISQILLNNMKKKGIEFKLRQELKKIVPPGMHNGGGCVLLEDDVLLPADKVLFSVGRTPNISGIGLDKLGLLIENGAIVTDDYLRTNIPNIYAAGDANGKSMLAHTAYREAECAVSHMLGNPMKMRYGAIPTILYTNPEAACVGETEHNAAANGLNIKTIKLPMRYSGRYVAEIEGGDGICKVVFDAKKRTVIGVHIIGSYASEIILSAQMMIESQRPVEALRELVYAHPTVGEVLREAMFMYKL